MSQCFSSGNVGYILIRRNGHTRWFLNIWNGVIRTCYCSLLFWRTSLFLIASRVATSDEQLIRIPKKLDVLCKREGSTVKDFGLVSNEWNCCVISSKLYLIVVVIQCLKPVAQVQISTYLLKMNVRCSTIFDDLENIVQYTQLWKLLRH